MRDETLLDVFFNWAKEEPEETIIKYKPEDGGDYVDVSWGELRNRVTLLASGLLKLDMKKGDRISIFSANRIEWIVADLAILALGGVDVPIYHTNTPDQCHHIINDSGSRFIFVDTHENV